MSTNIILVRHGQSEGNFERKFLGHTDRDLTRLGYRQAECTCQYLKDEKIDVIYSSDLIRAYNTVAPMAQSRGLEIIKNKNFREIYAGCWENQHVDFLSSEFGEDYSVWKTDIGNSCCTNGESVLELQKRVMNELRDVAIKNLNKTILIGTHATPVRTICAAIKNLTKDEIKNIPWATNASITRISYNDGKFKLISYGEDEFLGDLKINMYKNV